LTVGALINHVSIDHIENQEQSDQPPIMKKYKCNWEKCTAGHFDKQDSCLSKCGNFLISVRKVIWENQNYVIVHNFSQRCSLKDTIWLPLDAISLNNAFWEGVELLHSFGFITMLSICDGASKNRKFIYSNVQSHPQHPLVSHMRINPYTNGNMHFTEVV
jgi:hypothetical protein